MTADDVIRLLGLRPHPVEGGFFRETYRSAFSTAIYYLLKPGHVSELHVLQGDEVYHFYLGSPVRMLQLWPDGTGKEMILGPELAAGQLPQLVVPGGVWQGSVLVDGGSWALLGATMAPGFDYADYTAGDRAELSARYPALREMIERLTPAAG